jgi:AraC-like DNA-binding protein
MMRPLHSAGFQETAPCYKNLDRRGTSRPVLAEGGIGARAPAINKSVSKFARVVDYIDAAIEGDLTLEAVADVAGINAFSFVRAFRRQFGETPHRFVLQQRIDAPNGCLAKRKLRWSRLHSTAALPAKAISLRCSTAKLA